MSKPSLTNELIRLHELLEKGAITQDEYNEHKAILINEAKSGNKYDGNDGNRPISYTQPIIINQSASAAASAAASAKSGGGCLSSILKGIGLMVVIGTLISMCATDDKKNKDTFTNAQNVSTFETTEISNSQELDALLEKTKNDHVAMSTQISDVWGGLNDDVRAHLKQEQIAWNRTKDSECLKANEDTIQEKQIAQLVCEMEMMHDRINILFIQQEVLLPKLQEEKLQKVTAETENALGELQATWNSLPDTVQEAINEDFKSWSLSQDEICKKKSKANTDIQANININICITKSVNAKIQELNGYKI